jgi:hypothetical protein
MTSTPTRSRIHNAILAATTGLVLTAAAIATADAADRGQRSGARATQSQAHKPRPPGDYTRHTEVRRTDNGHTRTDTWTGERGTATRQAEVVNDRANRTRARNVEWTGPQGQQAKRTDVTQRTDSGYTRQSTATGPNGGIATRSVVATRDREAGTWTKDVTVDRTPPPAGDGG